MVAVMKGQETIEAHHSLIPTSVNIPLQPGMPVITANSFKTARTPLIYAEAETKRLKQSYKFLGTHFTHAHRRCVHKFNVFITGIDALVMMDSLNFSV